MAKTKILFMSDLHTGSRTGVTPPDWQWEERNKARKYWARLQRIGWDWLMEERKTIGKVDLLILDGDCVDGPEEKNAGHELVIPDLKEQVQASADVIRALSASHVAIVKGSRYHVGKAVFLEEFLADELGIETPLWENRFEIDGKIFNVKHKIGKTSLPHTQYTPLARDCLNDLLNTVLSDSERSDVIVRAHIHRFAQLDFEGVLAFTLPGMQFPETDYGKAECSGLIHVGFLEITIEGGEITWKKHLIPASLYARPVAHPMRRSYVPRVRD